MIRVGLYLENKRIADVDLSKPEKGNPGIGGTEYNFINMPYNFARCLPGEVEFIFFANAVEHLPKEFSSILVDDFISAVQSAEESFCDILIWRPSLNTETSKYVEAIDDYNVNIVAWVHNTPELPVLDKMSRANKLKRFVVVSHEQIDAIRDHPIIYKSSLVQNGFDLNSIPLVVEQCKDPNMVVYVGSLVPAKGFSLLAEAWPEILERVPSAQLYVIGSGRLYNRGAVLGKWGVAEESFESEKIRPYLSGESGDIIPSVHFLGALGEEKNKYLLAASVGVVNPTGLTENCPGSAIEFQAAKTPVVSAAENGLLDTVVQNETGLLSKNKNEFIDDVVYLLSTPSAVVSFGDKGRKFVDSTYGFNKISSLWLGVFQSVVGAEFPAIVPMKKNILYKRKWCRELIRMVKSHLYTDAYHYGFLDDKGEKDSVFVGFLSRYLDGVMNEIPKNLQGGLLAKKNEEQASDRRLIQHQKKLLLNLEKLMATRDREYLNLSKNFEKLESEKKIISDRLTQLESSKRLRLINKLLSFVDKVRMNNR